MVTLCGLVEKSTACANWSIARNVPPISFTECASDPTAGTIPRCRRTFSAARSESAEERQFKEIPMKSRSFTTL